MRAITETSTIAMTMNPTIEIDEASFEIEVLKSRQPVLVEFSTEWSLPSMMMNGAIDEIATEFVNCLKVARVKLDSSPNLGLWYNIRCLPTILYFTGGEVRAGIFGSTSKEAVLSHLQPVISASCTPKGAPQSTEFQIASPTASLNGASPARLDSDSGRRPAPSINVSGGRDPWTHPSLSVQKQKEKADE
jgi:thioredoxin-like negative regulator of GroEL